MGPRSGTSAPRILVASWLKWISAARVASALTSAGARVDAVFPPLHPLQSVTGLNGRHDFSEAQPSTSLRCAIEASQPDLIVAGDDVAVDDLMRLRLHAGGPIADLIDRSLGSAGAFETLRSRTRLIRLAQEEDVLAPATQEIATADALVDWLAAHGAPAFVKLDGAFGGNGVRLIADATDARALFADVTATTPPDDAPREAGRPTTPVVSVQRAIDGRPANCGFFSWQGEVLGLVGVEVLKTIKPFGVATVVRIIEHPMMKQAAVRIARRLQLTGLHGLDFMIEAATGDAWLIEMNGRPTPISHLRLGPGRDLPGAIMSALGARPTAFDAGLADGAVIALFPHMLKERPSPAPRDSMRDIPWNQPGLIGSILPAHKLALPLFREAMHRLLA